MSSEWVRYGADHIVGYVDDVKTLEITPSSVMIPAPTKPSHAATKAYVDATVVAASTSSADLTVTWTQAGQSTLPQSTVRIAKAGQIVSLTSDYVVGTAASTDTIFASEVIPAAYRPSSTVTLFSFYWPNTQSTGKFCQLEISPNGDIELYSTSDGDVFSAGNGVKIGFNVSYVI